MTLSSDGPDGPPEPVTAVLVVTAEEGLLDDLLRLAAAAGVMPDVAADSGAALRAWPTAGVVLVGADQAAALAARRPARRGRVHVVTTGAAADSLFRSAVTLGAASVLELPAADPWLVELLADAEDGSVGARGHGRRGGRLRRCGRHHVRLRAGRQPPRSTAPPCSSTPTPSARGAERVLGLEERPGIRWDALLGAGGRLSVALAARGAAPPRRPGRAGLARPGALQPRRRYGAGGAARRRSAGTGWWSSTCPAGSTTVRPG